MYKYVLNFVVKFVKYFEYYVIMLRGVFCGHAVFLRVTLIRKVQ